jgi:hypothetical protein
MLQPLRAGNKQHSGVEMRPAVPSGDQPATTRSRSEDREFAVCRGAMLSAIFQS